MLAERVELAARRALDDRETALYYLGWYDRATTFCRAQADRVGCSVSIVAGIVAALSPRTYWEQQIESTPAVLDFLAESFPFGLSNPDAKDIPGPGTGANKQKALKIWQGADPLKVLGGTKVRAFYRSLIGNTDSVCIDVWASRAAYGETPKSLTPKRFRECIGAYKLAAARLQVVFPDLAERLNPRDVQALVWNYTRNPEKFYPSLF
jgi:hypothetical protein